MNRNAEIAEFIDCVKRLQARARAAGGRAGVVLSGRDAWLERHLAALRTVVPVADGWCYGDAPGVFATRVDHGNCTRFLGCETPCLIFDSRQGLDVNAFAALSGTVTAGGMMVLLTPPLGQWGSSGEPFFLRHYVRTAGAAAPSRYVARFVRLLQHTRDLWCVEEGRPLPAVTYPPGGGRPSSVHRPGEPDSPCRSADQAEAVAAIIKVATGHRRRPLVLVADRGRGKTAALGIAAARLIESDGKRIVITAPCSEAVNAAMVQVRRLLSGDARAAIRFVPPDQLLGDVTNVDLVLVDEAAAIPPAILTAILEKFPRVVFATTIHGYEGTGRGFALRFQAVLNQRTPQWRERRLSTPIRWAAGDPLERFVFQAMLLDVSAVDDEQVTVAEESAFRLQRISQAQLLADEFLLQELFGLLVNAHYRTRPSDLHFILDAPALEIFAVICKRHVVAAVLVVTDEGLDKAAMKPVYSGSRRVRGALLPQVLGLHAGGCIALGETYQRVLRIAVHPVLQRRGWGTRLLEWVSCELAASGHSWLGACFGAEAGLLRFWRVNGFTPAHIGFHRGATSGGYPVVVLKALAGSRRPLLEQWRRQFVESLAYSLIEPLADLGAGVVLELLAGSGADVVGQDRMDPLLEAFAFGHRRYEAALPVLVPFVWNMMQRPDCVARLMPLHRELLVRKVLQRHSWERVARALGFPGRRPAEAALREALRAAISLAGYYAAGATVR